MSYRALRDELSNDCGSLRPSTMPGALVPHTIKLKGMLTDVITHARADVGKVHDPKAQALFETTAEVLGGLVTAFEDFE